MLIKHYLISLKGGKEIGIPLFPFIAAGVAILFLFMRRSRRRAEDQYEEFWERERNAKTTRPVDLTTLPYLNVPIDRFQFGTLSSPEVQGIENEIREISQKPLLNLTGKTNTELRETYGSPNFEAMKEIGEDFDRLASAIIAYANAMIQAGETTLAITVLEYGVFIKSDLSKNYTLLADCFKKMGQKRRISTLRDQVLTMNLATEPLILKHLDSLLESFPEENQETLENFNTEEKEE